MEDLERPEPAQGDVEGGEAEADSDGALDPVHAQPLVHAADEALVANHPRGRSQDTRVVVGVAGHTWRQLNN